MARRAPPQSPGGLWTLYQSALGQVSMRRSSDDRTRIPSATICTPARTGNTPEPRRAPTSTSSQPCRICSPRRDTEPTERTCHYSRRLKKADLWIKEFQLAGVRNVTVDVTLRHKFRGSCADPLPNGEPSCPNVDGALSATVKEARQLPTKEEVAKRRSGARRSGARCTCVF